MPDPPTQEALILESFFDPSIADPLSEVTRTERKALLIASLVAAAVAQGGLIPKKVEALGIDLSPAQVTSLLYIIALLLAYLLLGFFLYALADLKHRNLKVAAGMARTRPIVQRIHAEYTAAQAKTGANTPDALSQALAPLAAAADQTKMTTALLRASRIRLAFEVYLPILIGLVALALTLVHTKGFPGWRYVAGIAIVTIAVASATATWKGRKRIRHWFALRRHRFYDRRTKRLTERLKRSEPGSPRHARLQAKARAALERSIRGPWV
jgi:hypothetical protein